MPDVVHVAVAVLVNEDDEVCISLRHKEAHQGGLWEFPGGKIEPGETVEQALTREIAEELDLAIESSRPLITINHHYSDKSVCLHVRKVLAYKGQATGVEGQQIKWVPVSQLPLYDFPDANLPIVNAIQLPEKYLITGSFIDHRDFMTKLDASLKRGIKLVQLRLKSGCMEDAAQVQVLVEAASQLCKQSKVKLMLNLSADYLKAIDLSHFEFDGFHADSKSLMLLSQRKTGQLFSASCHNKDELLQAETLQADFIVLSPVQKTASHPEVQALGWQQFTRMVENISVPVFALGGLSEDDIEKAWSCGAQGVAAISAFWG
jgi:8-oxo-dGTP diphosphatase